jgi:hypothetical protein
VGVRNSTSDLLMNNCDEFLFYDDLVQAKSRKSRSKSQPAKSKTPAKKSAAKKTKAEAAKQEPTPQDEALDLVLGTAEALIAERGDRVFGSMVKQTLKRRRPGFSEGTYGFSSFGELLEHASERGLVDIEMDERSGGYVIRSVKR